MPSVVFRCDASSVIGSGHIIRCRTLARHLQSFGFSIVFICRSQPGDLVSLLADEFTVLTLPNLKPYLPAKTDLPFRYELLLNCSQKQDAEETLQLLLQNSISDISWFVLDHYAIDSTWQETLLSQLSFLGFLPPKILVIDDLANRVHHADVLLDQNYYDSCATNPYANLVPSTCLQLRGSYYSLLSSDYLTYQSLIRPRKSVKRILVFFGGSDLPNLTSLVLNFLSGELYQHYFVDVVIGAQNPHSLEVEALSASRPNTELHRSVSSLSQLIFRSDLSFGAGGTTTYERSCLSLPSLVITLAENQVPIAQLLHDYHYHYYLGHFDRVSLVDITQAFHHLLDNFSLYSNSPSLTDGHGVSRVVTAMNIYKPMLHLRPVNANDEWLLFNWANDPSARFFSINRDYVTIQEHRRWFASGLHNKNRFHWIAVDKLGCAFGQIRFDLIDESNTVRVSISLDESARGKGLSKILLSSGIKAVRDQLGANTRVVAQIFSSNPASIACFLGVGFSQISVPGSQEPLSYLLEGKPVI